MTLDGSATASDVVSVTVENANLAGGQETAQYTVAGGNTLTNVATGVAAAINADANLAAIGVGASSSAAVLTVSTDTSYTASTSGGATETISVGTSYRGNVRITLGGKPTTSDTLTITVQNPSLSGGSKAETYTVLSTDSMASIGAGLAALINGDATLKTLGISVNNAASLAFSESFSGNAIVPSGASVAQGSGVDGSSNTATNPAQVNVQGGSGASLSFDANGNCTSDGTNSYKFDAENGLIEIDYPGSGNNSQFTYDGRARISKLVETTSGSVTSTQQFIWAQGTRREARDGSGSVTAQFFGKGETIGGTKYFYTFDHPGSIREMTNSSGVIEAQYSYDPFGRRTDLVSTVPSDFRFANYFWHGRSGLNLTRTRPYSASLGRFLYRDPLMERSGVNLFAYVSNSPINHRDVTGMCASGGCGWGNGYGWGSDPSFGWSWTPGNDDPNACSTGWDGDPLELAMMPQPASPAKPNSSDNTVLITITNHFRTCLAPQPPPQSDPECCEDNHAECVWLANFLSVAGLITDDEWQSIMKCCDDTLELCKKTYQGGTGKTFSQQNWKDCFPSNIIFVGGED